MKSIQLVLLTCLVLPSICSVNAQTFNWTSNRTGGGFYQNIDGSGIDLKIEGLVNAEVVGESIKTGRNDQQAHQQIHSYVFTFSENVDVEFTISDINLDTTKACYDDEVVLTGEPYIIKSNKLNIVGDTIRPLNKSYIVQGTYVTVQYHNVNQFTIKHGSGKSCNPGSIMMSPIKFQPAQSLLQFGADTTHFDNIQFDLDHKELKQVYHASLDTLLKTMKENGKLKVMLVGFADDQSDKTYNSKLSRKRVNAVLTYLLLKGVDRSKIDAAYYGDKIPKKSNVNLYGNGQNRRVEIYIVK